jgi:hypothetical protein
MHAEFVLSTARRFLPYASLSGTRVLRLFLIWLEHLSHFTGKANMMTAKLSKLFTVLTGQLCSNIHRILMMEDLAALMDYAFWRTPMASTLSYDHRLFHP